MAYIIELGPGYSLSLLNQGPQTSVTLTSVSPGQQQQSSFSFATGIWLQAPAAFRNSAGVWIVVTASSGTCTLKVQQNQVTASQGEPDLHDAQRLQLRPLDPVETPAPGSSTQPLPPLQPLSMQLGDMTMSMSPMQMRMGDRSMDLQSPLPLPKAQPTQAQRFCTQCGAALRPGDRFCGSCGYKLQDETTT